MALDINKTANQINEFANEFKNSYSEHSERIYRAREAYIQWSGKNKNSGLDSACNGYLLDFTGFTEEDEFSLPIRETVNEYRAISTDGSHIGIDRDLPAKCFLINIGIADFLYGDEANAELTNIHKLYVKA
jgi:hypothetical protein